MPIRINLKELFPSDSQEVHVDKTNYNFNKLLELGIGERGMRGLLGGVGGAGPIGIDGDQGPRGATWFVDAGTDPNLLTFPIDLIDGDMYLDSTNLAIWQYDGTNWIFVADISGIINNYLLASPSPFIRGFGVGLDDDRYIMFNNRNQPDNVLGISGPQVDNDILFLNNWDEENITNFLVPPVLPPGAFPNTKELFNSILAVSVDHTTVNTGRYHLELGVLYTNLSLDSEMTTILENFKGKFYKNQGSIHPGVDYNTEMLFSLDLPELIPSTSRLSNGSFKFQSSKYLPGSGVSDSSFTYIGSRYAIDELAAMSELTKVDGIAFYDDTNSAIGTIGMSVGNLVNGGNFPSDTGYIEYAVSDTHFMLEPILNTKSLYLNYEVWQDKGNIIQLGTSDPREKDVVYPKFGTPASFNGHAGIAVIGTELYTIAGDPNIKTFSVADLNAYGYFNRYSIDDPTKIISKFEDVTQNYSKFNGKTDEYGSPVTGLCTQNYVGETAPVGSGVSDIASFGEYLCVVNTQQRGLTDNSRTNAILPSGPNIDFYDHTYFQVLKTNDYNRTGLTRIGTIGWDGDPLAPDSILDSAYRVKMYGNYAIVGTCNLYGFNSNAEAFEMNGINYRGKLAAIDVSDPINPVIVSYVEPRATLTALQDPNNAIMDLDIIGEYAIILNWEQETLAYNALTNPTNTVNIDVKVFSLSGLDTYYKGIDREITFLGKSTTKLLSTSGDESAIANIQRRGAICANREKIYAAHMNKINVYSLTTGIPTTSFPICDFSYTQLTSDSTSIPSGRSIYDMKLVGNSLYVLAIDDLTNYTYISKFDITNRTESTTELDLIWTKLLENPDGTFDVKGDRFEVIGKHIYVATSKLSGSADTGIPSLIAIDFDGIYTGGAHIESLRADKLNVTKDADFGGEVKAHSSMTVGAELGIGGDLSVMQNIRAPRITHLREETSGIKILVAVPGDNIIDFDPLIEVNDINNEFTSNTFRPKYSGIYLINVAVTLIGVTDFSIKILKNSVSYQGSYISNSGISQTHQLISSVHLEKTDDVEIAIAWTNGAGAAYGCVLSIDRLV